ncbi:MAG: TIM44-like domain-containing protein, partial [Pyrinomonadaceae bacterium]
MIRRRYTNISVRGAVITATATAVCLSAIIFSPEALARVGGGQSYGGGSGGGGGGGLGSLIYLVFRLLLWLTIEYPAIGIPLDIIVISYIVYRLVRKKKPEPSVCSADSSSSSVPRAFNLAATPAQQQNLSQQLGQLRRFDPNFSEIIFTDFCYALYAKAHDARGHGARSLSQLSPYLSDAARASLLQRNPPNLREVTGIIVGAMRLADVRGMTSPVVQVSVEFEANYTEVTGPEGGQTQQMTYYVRERWDMERKRDVLSPTPQQATALHCPRCGAPLQTDTVGACAYCGAKIESGEFQWYVKGVALTSREARGPLLTSDVPEVGTNYPTVVQPGFQNVRENFEKNHPEFVWGEFQARARLIFNELQAAWSTLQWDRARPHETDNIFQMHRYWIDAYKRQGLRNILDKCEITRMQPVKIKEDAFYNSITLRIYARGYDYTVDQTGKVVSGSNSRLREWSEYWTFIRSRNATPSHARADLNCPNCGAQLKVNETGVCQFCGGKVSSGEFDWVLSK